MWVLYLLSKWEQRVGLNHRSMSTSVTLISGNEDKVEITKSVQSAPVIMRIAHFTKIYEMVDNNSG